LTGRGINVSAKVLSKSFLLLVKLIDTLYLAKWKGKAGINRLRAVKGESLSFFQIHSEKFGDLRKIESQLKKHGIMYAKLPDLCGGDGNTQYAFSPSDAEKMKLFIKNYEEGFVTSNGKRNNIKFSLITGEDYERTGYKDGKKTKEYEDLEKSAAQEQKKQQEKAKAEKKSKAGYEDTKVNVSPKVFLVESRINDPAYHELPFNKSVAMIENQEKHTIEFNKDRSSVLSRSDYEKSMIMVSIPQEPLAVIFTENDLGQTKKNGVQTAVLKDDKEYWVVNKLTLQKSKMKGRELAEQFKKPYLRESLSAKRNMVKNRPSAKTPKLPVPISRNDLLKR